MWYDGEYKCINSGRKVRELSLPEEGLRWFWLHDLIYTGYSSVTHAMIRALCERWHTKTSSFHLSMGEMTITLDDVYNLLHLPIQGRMLDHDAVVDRDHGITQMTRLLGMSDVAASAEAKTECGAHISYPTLKRLYKAHPTEARRLEESQSREEMLESDRRRQWCVRSFPLYLVGSVLFTNKTNRHIDLVYLDCMADLQTIEKWSCVGMTFAYLYHYLDDSVRLNNRAMAGCVTLLLAII